MKTLEGHKFFPYIAWGALVLFSLFTYNLVLNLQASFDELEKQTNSNVTASRAN
jgi:hypothetical protein